MPHPTQLIPRERSRYAGSPMDLKAAKKPPPLARDEREAAEAGVGANARAPMPILAGSAPRVTRCKRVLRPCTGDPGVVLRKKFVDVQ
eukprot:1156980-Pelagomonas_calceolata.AAC.5